MTNISLPSTFDDLLRKDQRLSGVVFTTLSNYGEILKENRLYFFEEYTDHGITHIENVIRGCERLVKDETLKYILSTDDIAYLILSVVLHDLGMHLNFEGLQALLNGEYDDVRVKEIDTLTWAELWQEYLIEAKRFSGKQLNEIFGNESISIQDPVHKQKDELTGTDKKLIGEFIRKYHPRIAHEIALKGMPGTQILDFASGLDTDIKNLVGLVARSHGMDLRTCLDYLILRYGTESKRNAFNTHWVFLMILLRISDYLQIDKSRSLFNLVLKLRTFESPVSQLEHEVHQAITNVENRYQDDPEKIFVFTKPQNSVVYLKLKKLIESIQYEFDMSWAVLGELYGNINGKPEIKFRRIASNLGNGELKSRLDYVPDAFSFKANEDIVKLLIAPLYGNDPKYGVRELLQNAVDACNEKRAIEGSESTYVPIVSIKLFYEKGQNYFEIRDNGKGMSIEEIKNYFLNAGASYRNSLDWKKEFVDEMGNAKVNRTGRFGIGVLASFLIGQEVAVETRKKGIDFGLAFKTTLNNNQINILKNNEIEEGTLIRIKTTDEVAKRLNHEVNKDLEDEIDWKEWYVMETPKVEYKIFENRLKKGIVFLPHYNNYNQKEWQAIDSSGYDKILWSYNQKYEGLELVCNGFVIANENSGLLIDNEFIDLGFMENKPCIHVFDSNGVLPLSLDRNNLTEKVTFAEDLREAVYKDFIARLLTMKKISLVDDSKIKIVSQNIDYPGLDGFNIPTYHSYGPGNYYNFKGEANFSDGGDYNRSFLNQLLISKRGYILNYNYFVRNIKPTKLVLIQSDNESVKTITLDLQDNFFLFSREKLNTIEEYRQAIHGETLNIRTNKFDHSNTRIHMKLERYHYLFHSENKRVPDWLKDVSDVESEYKGWVKLKIDNPGESIIEDKFLGKHKSDLNFIRETPLYCLNEGDQLFNKLLNRYLGSDVIIPFSLEDRKLKYPLAFEELKEYMEKYL